MQICSSNLDGKVGLNLCVRAGVQLKLVMLEAPVWTHYWRDLDLSRQEMKLPKFEMTFDDGAKFVYGRLG